MVELIQGDCLEKMKNIKHGSIDIVLTDPPYGLGFMNKDWDHGIPGVAFWQVISTTMKPGAHLLAFGGTRTFHRLTCAIEDAGFEIRDCVMWVYGSGFPKSLDVSKAIDKAAGHWREVVGRATDGCGNTESSLHKAHGFAASRETEYDVTAPATDAARQWDGWGTALKPAWEPIIVARKPLDGTVAENVQRHGTGAININGCRVVAAGGTKSKGEPNRLNRVYGDGMGGLEIVDAGKGRWPANLIHDGSDEVVDIFPKTKSGNLEPHSAARFFYCAKASSEEKGWKNIHPTVKPINLMRYLCRLVTPPGGTILDPFMGSGTTGVAAVNLNRNFIGIELDKEYFKIAENRINEAIESKRPKCSNCSNSIYDANNFKMICTYKSGYYIIPNEIKSIGCDFHNEDKN